MNAIEFKNVSKKFKKGEQFDSLRDFIPNLVNGIFGRNGNSVELHKKEFWALKDVSFELKRGECLGIIGANGSGKSTILKLLSNILKPTKGEIEINGKLSALIEVGAGFHGDLTGRENIYLNGAILGIKKKEIDRKFDSIVYFSELEEFIDTPVKRYSSGMYVRLGFSVAAHMDPDILLVDEVLSVGDMSFQRKCSEWMIGMRKKGLSLILITHNLELVNHLCDRALLLEKGVRKCVGDPFKICEDYRVNVKYTSNTSIEQNNSEIAFTGVSLFDKFERQNDSFNCGENIKVHISFEAFKHIENPVFSLVVTNAEGIICLELATSYVNYNIENINKGKGEIILLLQSLTLTSGVYFISIAVADNKTLTQYDYRKDICHIKIDGFSRGRGVVAPFHKWEFIQ